MSENSFLLIFFTFQKSFLLLWSNLIHLLLEKKSVSLSVALEVKNHTCKDIQFAKSLCAIQFCTRVLANFIPQQQSSKLACSFQYISSRSKKASFLFLHWTVHFFSIEKWRESVKKWLAMKVLKMNIINFDMGSRPMDSFCNHWDDSEGHSRICTIWTAF